MLPDGSLDSCRVILANEPRLFRELLGRALEATPGLEVVGETADPEEITGMLERTRAEWVIVPLTGSGLVSSRYEALLFQYPSLRILALSPDGRLAHEQAVDLEIEPMHNISLSELIRVLHTRSGRGRLFSDPRSRDRQPKNGGSPPAGL